MINRQADKRRFSLFHPRWVLPLATLVLCFIFTELWVRNQTFERLEAAYTDAWHQMHGRFYEPKHVSLLLIDETSLNVYKDTPLAFWTPLFAEAARILTDNGAKVIGMDFLFSTTAEQWLRQFNKLTDAQNYDQPLREAFSRGKVVLVTTTNRQGDLDEIVMPVPDFWLSLPNQDVEKYISFANLPPDRDGVIRSYHGVFPLNLSDDIKNAPRPRYTFGALLALHASDFSPEILARIQSLETDRTPIVFSGPPKTIPSISFADLLKAAENGKPLPEDMRQKIAGHVVIIGSDYGGLNDNHITPYGTGLWKKTADTLWMSGPEIQANVAESLLNHLQFRPLATHWRALFLLITFALGFAAFRYLSNTAGIAALLLFLAVYPATGYALFLSHTEFPVFAAQLSLVLGFTLIYGLRFFGETRTRKQIEQAFGRYTSKAVVSKLVEMGQMPELGGEAVEISVLFSDIRNFTSMSERLPPQRVIEMINTYLGKAALRVEEAGGNIDKFIGDAIMAEFGAPIPHPDHARRALRAALSLHAAVEEFRPWFHEHFYELRDFDFRIGVGIHSGTATMGNIGSSSRLEYTALGDTVNIASRLEGVTKELQYDIVASEATVIAAGAGVITGRSTSVKVKGREEPIKVFEILGLEEASIPAVASNPSA